MNSAEDAARVVHRRVQALASALDDALEQGPSVARAARMVADRLHRGGRVLTLGNGGSAAMADHLAAELVGRLRADRERAPLGAASLTGDAATVTALANDYGFEHVFARQLLGCARAEDVAVFFSTSGTSPNVVMADQVARDLGLLRVAFLGRRHGPLDEANVVVRIDSEDPGTVQEAHLLLLHAFTEEIELACGFKQRAGRLHR